MSKGTCPVCGETFELNPVGRPRIYCSVPCRDQRVQRGRARATSCVECGAPIASERLGAPRIYCSDACRARVNSRRSRRRVAPASTPDQECRECGRTFTPKRAASVYCSRRCYQRGNKKRPKFVREQRSCVECGALYEAWRYDQRFCTNPCAHRFHIRAHMNRKRTGVQAPYNDRDIFERDGWVCWLCGEPVDPALSRKHKRGATIDHVVPLSRGGADTPENVRLAHWECNHAKHTRIVA